MQTELYPSATKKDIVAAKRQLQRFRKDKRIVTEYERSEPIARINQNVYNEALKRVKETECAVRLILDPDIREMVEHKYINGELRRHKDTINRFSIWDQSTVGRKLNEGIVSIAESIKLFYC